MAYRLKDYEDNNKVTDYNENKALLQKSKPKLVYEENDITVLKNFGALSLKLIGAFVFLYFVLPFFFSIWTGSYFEYSELENKYPETWVELDEKERKAFVRMSDKVRSKIDLMPLNQRVSEVQYWWSRETSFCRYGEGKRIDGYKSCRTKKENDLGNFALDSLLNSNN